VATELRIGPQPEGSLFSADAALHISRIGRSVISSQNVRNGSRAEPAFIDTLPIRRQDAAGGGKGGADFALQQENVGALSIAQVNYFFNHASGDKGLPGQYALGAFYDGNTFSNLANINSQRKGTYSIYSQFQQMVHRVGDADSHRGLTVWAETAIAPKASVNKIPYVVATGLSYEGLIHQRSNDIVSVGVISGIFSRYIPRTTAETVIEMNYQITLKRWFSITPDLQYVIRPSGSSAVGNAFSLGAQTTIVF
jgi:carbohydrate-selective porin OprB